MPSDGNNSSLIESLVRLGKKGPLWLRGMALLLACLTALGPYANYLKEWLDNRQLTKMMQSTSAVVPPSQSGSSQSLYGSGGIPVAPPPGSGPTFDILNEADEQELTRHIVVLEEHPSFKRIFVAQHTGMVAYSVFPSDGCMVIKHFKNGHIKTDLVRSESTNPKPVQESDYVARITALNVSWNPVRSNNDSLRPETTDVVQGCKNPHPGQFKYWQGPPKDSCWGPIFRQFKDGCTHYQMFNRCNKTWDPVIHWTVCVSSSNHY